MSSTVPTLDSMASLAAAAAKNGLTEVDPAVGGFGEVFSVLALSWIVGVAVLAAFAVGALWLTIWQEADEF